MPEECLFLELEAREEDHPEIFSLVSNSLEYPITWQPERDFILNNLLRRLPSVMAGEKDSAREFEQPERLFMAVGARLWQALLPDAAPVQAREELACALRGDSSPILLRLPARLAGLPWELLYDPQQKDEKGFVSLHRPLVRLVPAQTHLLPTELPLRVLLLLSSPLDLPKESGVEVESERTVVQEATRSLQKAGVLKLLVEDIATPDRIERALKLFRPHILHYVGHGMYEKESGGELLWEDVQGRSLKKTAQELAQLLCSHELHAVILHACQTAKGDIRTDSPSLAEILIKEGIPIVLAQQASLTYDSSQLISAAFYTALGAGQSFADALFTMRQALLQAQRPDWAVPIMYGSMASLKSLLNKDTSASHAGHPNPRLIWSEAAGRSSVPTKVFVGRRAEMRALHLMLESEPEQGAAMALITGPAGIGKSTLTTQAAKRYGGHYKAIFTFDCQNDQHSSQFLRGIAERLQQQGFPAFLEYILPDPSLSIEMKIEKAIAALNQSGPFLLLIDNLEQVQNEDLTLTDPGLLMLLQKLLTTLQGGRVIVNGRYALKDFPSEGESAALPLRLDLDELSSYEVKQLTKRSPGLAQLSDFVEILIQEFGGLPYIYGLLSSEAVAGEDLVRLIHDGHGYITEEVQDRRQQIRTHVIETTLKAIVNRLPEPSRSLLGHLSLLRISFPLTAIEGGLGATQTIWQPLLDCSLLHHDPWEKSYSLHSLTRRYAETLLDKQDQTNAQRQLAAWFEDYAGHVSHNPAHALEAHRLWREAGELHRAGELAVELAFELAQIGDYRSAQKFCMQTLADIAGTNSHLKAQVIHVQGRLAEKQGNFEKADGLLEESLDILRRLKDQAGVVLVLRDLGMVAFSQGDYDAAESRAKEGWIVAMKSGNPKGQAMILQLQATILHEQGQDVDAKMLVEQSLAIAKQLEDLPMLAYGHHLLSTIMNALGMDEEASLDLEKEHRRMAIQMGDMVETARSSYHQAMLLHSQGELHKAREIYEQCLEFAERASDAQGQASIHGQLSVLALNMGDCDGALSHAIRAFRLFDSHSPLRKRAHGLIDMIRETLGEEVFMQRWKTLVLDDRFSPPPCSFPPGLRSTLHQFGTIPAQAKQRFLGMHPELLGPEVDALLEEQIVQQLNPNNRQVLGEIQQLLARCRKIGIEAACAEYEVACAEYKSMNIVMTPMDITQMNALCNTLVDVLLGDNAQEREAMARELEKVMQKHLAPAELYPLFSVLLAWLCGQDEQQVTALARQLPSPLYRIYANMVADVKNEGNQ